MLKTPRLKTCVLAVTMAALPLFVNAAGLGRLNVLSGLGQPFRGEIDLVFVQPGEADSLVVSLAPPDAFSTAQITYPSSSLGLRFNIEKRGNGQYYVTVNSAQAITEPFLDLLVELNWASGRIQREYTALIDPVGYAPSLASGSSTKFSPSVLPGTRTTGAIKSTTSKPYKAVNQDVQTKEPVATESRKDSSAQESVIDSYKTKGGDTLSAVAKKIKPEGVSLDQVLVSLYRSNTDAFDGNMNRLKRGKILRVQSALEMQQVGVKEARKEVQVQSANWSEYRSKLGEAAAKAPARDLTEQASGGKITAKVEDQGASAVDKNKDVLKLSKAADAAKKSADNSKMLALEEEVAARHRALNEANQRVEELQKNVADMEKLAAMRSKVVAPASAVASPIPDAVKSSAPESIASDVAVVASNVAAASEKAASAVVASAPVAKVKKRVEVVADVPEEPGFVESLFENPLALGGGALAILLGAGGLWYARRRQRPGVFEDSIITGGDLKANTVLGSTGGGVISTQSTENSFLTDFSRQGLGTIDTDEVDPIAEAEVYMAYGRDAQAEEILKDALQKDPSRHEIRMKLLDIYAARKDKVSFEEHASALFAITGGKGIHWENAAENGRAIDPENPLYQALDASSGLVDTSVLAPAAVGVSAAASLMTDVTEPDVSESLDTDLDFELDLDPTKKKNDLSAFEAEPTEALESTDEFDFGIGELPLDDGNELSFNVPMNDLTDVNESNPEDKALSLPEAELSNEMMALDLPIDLGVPSVDADAEFASLDALADFDLDAALSPVQDSTVAMSSTVMNEFESMADSLDLDISSSIEELKDDSIESFAGLELPSLSDSVPESEDVAAGDVVLELGDIGLDFDFDLSEGVAPVAALDGGVAFGALDAPLGDISLGLDAAATDSELDFAADDPVQTKIDLARAYIDMGDVEGAREILQEALQEGSPDQQNTAKTLLSDL